MKTKITGIFLSIIFLVACVRQQSIPVDIQSTAMAAVQTYIALSQTPTLPVVTPIYPTPSPLPTQPPFSIITPDAVQVVKWREHQSALAGKLVSAFPVEIVLCEWEILGQTKQELYVWTVCVAPGYEASKPAAIHFNEDGSVQNVEVPLSGSTWDSDIQRIFPSDVRNRIVPEIFFQRSLELINHIEWRQTHLEEPPLIILSAMPAVTPAP
jgi:hypothetical protein